MSISPMVAQWVAAYERENGKPPAAASVKIAEHIERTGAQLRNQGTEDARKGAVPHQSEMFHALVRQIFRMDAEKHPEAVQEVAELWEADYLEGYRQGEETNA